VKFDLAASTKVSERYSVWSVKSGVHGVKMENVRHVFEKQMFCPMGTVDKDGNPVLFSKLRFYFPSATSATEVIHALIYSFKYMVRDEKACTDGITLFYNTEGWSMKNFSLSLVKPFIDAVTGKYPIRIRKMYAYNAPDVFLKMWNGLKILFPSAFYSCMLVLKLT
jgi:hypothetical protein